jgi:HEPN domain-containing protein
LKTYAIVLLTELYSALLVTAISDLKTANKLLQNGFFVHCLFYLSQAFEKANKSVIALIKQEYLNEPESSIEEYLLKRIGHDKKRATKEIVEFLQQRDNKNEFEQIKNELPKFIKSYKHFNSIKDFHSRIDEDFNIYNKFRTLPTANSYFLHQKYYERSSYRYQIICYILRRYFNEIETNIRYPTQANNYSINNPFNNETNRDALNKLSEMSNEFVNIVCTLLTDLLRSRIIHHT